jgi:hypothetical protein
MIHLRPCGFATDDQLWFESHQAQHILGHDHDSATLPGASWRGRGAS